MDFLLSVYDEVDTTQSMPPSRSFFSTNQEVGDR